MKKDTHKTKMTFLFNEDQQDLFAFFPEILEKEDQHSNFYASYSHIGQHSMSSYDYAAESRQATHEEYKDLAAELESIGYNLEILNFQNNEKSA